MYRCHLTQHGRIVAGVDLEAKTLEDAILAGRELFSLQHAENGWQGFEIWQGNAFLFPATG